jgi:competence ComEA-like helix-hairpin-helix protein
LKNNDSVFNDTSPSKSKKINLSKGPLDLNTATEKELQSINGIGPVLSEKIIAGRPYKSVEELITVKGIGPKRLKRFRRYFVIGKE